MEIMTEIMSFGSYQTTCLRVIKICGLHSSLTEYLTLLALPQAALEPFHLHGHLFLQETDKHRCMRTGISSHHITVDMQGRTVDFKNTLIIMTSNVGSSVIEKGGGGLGFQLDTSEEDSSYNRIKTLVNEELKQYFRPEFLNR